ncbi:MAG: LysR family transcriptional regulator [Rhodobacteraceae bacterium]|nr:LysR family transcriptional regulator [Paracoccaceae bacterium]
MQGHDWNDLKYLLVLHRTGKLSQAGRVAGVSETTVARRIRAFEQSLGIGLFVRTASGRYQATDCGRQIISHAETVERENTAIGESAGHFADRVTGVVRISSVAVIINRLLVPELARLRQQHPDLTIELTPDARNADLSKREADLAIRFSRPISGGLQTRTRKLGALAFGIFGPASASPDEIGAMGWIGYDEAHSALPQARWIETALARAGSPRIALRVADAETALEAAASGLGKTVLPIWVASADRRLQPVEAGKAPPLPVRDVWLLSHQDQSARSSVSVVKDWLSGLAWDRGR